MWNARIEFQSTLEHSFSRHVPSSLRLLSENIAESFQIVFDL
jgi:hypothetical protein